MTLALGHSGLAAHVLTSANVWQPASLGPSATFFKAGETLRLVVVGRWLCLGWSAQHHGASRRHARRPGRTPGGAASLAGLPPSPASGPTASGGQKLRQAGMISP